MPRPLASVLADATRLATPADADIFADDDPVPHISGLDLARDLAPAEYATWIAADHGEVAAADSGAGVLATSAGALAAVWAALEMRRGEALGRAAAVVREHCARMGLDSAAALAALEAE